MMKTFPWIFAVLAGTAVADPSASAVKELSSVTELYSAAVSVSVSAKRAEVPASIATDFDTSVLKLSRELDDQLQRRFEDLTLSAAVKEDYVADARAARVEPASAAERRQRFEGVPGRS